MGTEAYRYTGPHRSPAAAVSLRAIDPERFTIVNEAAGGEVMEEIEESKAFYEVYDGAVYMFQALPAPSPHHSPLFTPTLPYLFAAVACNAQTQADIVASIPVEDAVDVVRVRCCKSTQAMALHGVLHPLPSAVCLADLFNTSGLLCFALLHIQDWGRPHPECCLLKFSRILTGPPLVC